MSLRKQCGLRMPARDEDWAILPRTRILVKRETVLQDALVAVAGENFDPTKLLEVRHMLVGGKCTMWHERV